MEILLKNIHRCSNRISAGPTEKLLGWEKLRAKTVSCPHNMEGHAPKCVERYFELANEKVGLYKVSSPCLDDHQFTQIVLTGLHLRPDILSGQWTNLLDQSPNGQELATNVWQDWFPTYHANDYRQYCHVGQRGSALSTGFNSRLRLCWRHWGFKINFGEGLVYLGKPNICPWVGCARNKTSVSLESVTNDKNTMVELRTLKRSTPVPWPTARTPWSIFVPHIAVDAPDGLEWGCSASMARATGCWWRAGVRVSSRSVAESLKPMAIWGRHCATWRRARGRVAHTETQGKTPRPARRAWWACARARQSGVTSTTPAASGVAASLRLVWTVPSSSLPLAPSPPLLPRARSPGGRQPPCRRRRRRRAATAPREEELLLRSSARCGRSSAAQAPTTNKEERYNLGSVTSAHHFPQAVSSLASASTKVPIESSHALLLNRLGCQRHMNFHLLAPSRQHVIANTGLNQFKNSSGETK